MVATRSVAVSFRRSRTLLVRLTHFAVLSDGTKIDSPRLLRRAEKKPNPNR
ncbi:hypothetical protein PV706_26880 [Streptomyces europaeiscabiei]|uniref:Transposase n=1 Tax=Streptomyces europaeiscabiei TaxID=146819 RepID=A0ABU4NUW6_9ACTN|nr:hypothetical protein [Streptomyces europaeiscabiei]MDX2757188.1 hypothetical protein [Streptomyces europaeiscabiei]MDX3547474.1 hypothetical protein [Streptomyces europaeiscabiei]MDX3557909.1 hypothetical protein [Streptomyces europaeiscabiei]MDX3666979.1 hypothetical protein [Streptomyces europaeiscabiei]MDX3705634.1 hypothetical protein [Streptomyces europaeiscabiei]